MAQSVIVSLFCLALGIGPTAIAMPPLEVVEFHIAKGTGEGPWNTFNDPIRVRVGQILRFYNDDSVEHTMHTNGSPCEHGSMMLPGGTWDCEITSPHNSGDEDLYDHEFGPDAQVYIQADK